MATNNGVFVATNGDVYQQIDEPKHRHYFIDVSKYDEIDIYRITDLYGCNSITHHIAKKALCAGRRGHKDLERDLHDIIDTAQRGLEMIEEDGQ